MARRASHINGTPIRFFWDIREFILLLPRDRTYSLWQRLLLLGIFCKRLNELISSQQVGLVPKLLYDYAEMAATGNFRSAMNSIAVQPTIYGRIVKHLKQPATLLRQGHRNPGLYSMPLESP